MNTKIEGVRGESFAVGYLVKKGYKIIETNIKLMGIEVDIIAESPDKAIVFCEVKARQTLNFGHPLEAITPAKQNRYRTFAKQYIVIKRLANRDIRFDAIALLGDEITHIENAF
ncbi:MAG: YraN family protein [Clostridia bacterium]